MCHLKLDSPPVILPLLAASSSFGSGGYALTNPLGGMIIEDASVE